MSESSLFRPGIARGFYPEQKVEHSDGIEQLLTHGKRLTQRHIEFRRNNLQSFVELVNQHHDRLHAIGESELTKLIERLKRKLILDSNNEKIVALSFAIIREISARKLSMPHYDVQLMGGWAMFNGMLAEMQTGEGKTLTATLPACTAALAGIPVHIISVNDYLVTRDAELMKPIYDALGLSVGTITEKMDHKQRQAAYQCDITYCTGKQLIFDYLKDKLVLKQKSNSFRHIQLEQLYSSKSRSKELLLRGLCFAIVDEADSILIDEARTPLILSRQGKIGHRTILYRQALQLAEKLTVNQDYVIDQHHRSIDITQHGQIRLAKISSSADDFFKGKRRRTELVTQALSAQKLFTRDQHYLIKNSQVEIIDEHTGRSMPDRKWEGGLHQMIEIKETCEVTEQNETLARISNQSFFRRYLHLAGMTGTAKEVANELWSNYRLGVIPIPTYKPSRRLSKPTKLFNHSEDKWTAILNNIIQAHNKSQPVLIATGSVKTSEFLSQILHKNNLDHQVLNARQNKEEAEIIARAGQLRQITVATKMAGRGTDIKLAAGVAEVGGLHVILCEPNASRRIDRQIIGRCGRQGDPGSVESFFSYDDEIIQVYRSKRILKTAPVLSGSLPRLAQRSIEKQHKTLRQALLKSEKQIGTLLAFSGLLE